MQKYPMIAMHSVEQAMDSSNLARYREGTGIVYVYGYACLPDRQKVGST
jgi:hypothetical protein